MSDVVPEVQRQPRRTFLRRRSEPRRDPRPSEKAVAAAPTRMAFAWIPANSAGDAIAAARGYAENHFDAPKNSWYMVRPFAGGYFYEVHEGGRGRAWLPAIAKAFSDGKTIVWVRDRSRVHTVSVGKNRPVVMHQSTEGSRPYLAGGVGEEVARTRSRMKAVVWKGGGVLVAGLATFVAGAAFYAGTLTLTSATMTPDADPVRLRAENLPHRQWPQISAIPKTRYVAAFKFADDHWQAPVIRQVEKHRFTPTPLDIIHGGRMTMGENGEPLPDGTDPTTLQADAAHAVAPPSIEEQATALASDASRQNAPPAPPAAVAPTPPQPVTQTATIQAAPANAVRSTPAASSAVTSPLALPRPVGVVPTVRPSTKPLLVPGSGAMP